MEKKALAFLIKYADWIRHADLWSWIIQKIQWGITRIFFMISNLSEKLIDNVFSIFGFLDYPPIARAYQAAQSVSLIILAIAIAIIGFKMVSNKKIKIKDVTLRVIIYATLIAQMPLIMTSLQKVSTQFFKDSNQIVTSSNVENGLVSKDKNTLSFNIVKKNTADLAYVSKKGYKTLLKEDNSKNNLTNGQFERMDMSTILTPDVVSDIKAKSKNDEVEYLSYYMDYDIDGKKEAVKIKNGFFDFFDEGTFRYTGNHAVMNVSLFTLAIFNILLAIKLIFVVFDLVFRKITFPFKAFANLETGQKTKKSLEGMLAGFMTIGLIGLSRSVFIVFFAYLNTLNWNILAFALASFVGVVACLKGSDALAREFGVETGVAKEGMAVLGAGVGAGMLAKKGFESAKNAGQNLAEGTRSAIGKGKQSIYDGQEKLNEASHSLGKTVGHVSERGMGGFVQDKVHGVADNLTDKVSTVQSAVTKPVSTAKASFVDGTADGISEGVNARGSAPKDNTNLVTPSKSTTTTVPETNIATDGTHDRAPTVSTDSSVGLKQQPTRVPENDGTNTVKPYPRGAQNAEDASGVEHYQAKIPVNYGIGKQADGASNTEQTGRTVDTYKVSQETKTDVEKTAGESISTSPSKQLDGKGTESTQKVMDKVNVQQEQVGELKTTATSPVKSSTGTKTNSQQTNEHHVNVTNTETATRQKEKVNYDEAFKDLQKKK